MNQAKNIAKQVAYIFGVLALIVLSVLAVRAKSNSKTQRIKAHISNPELQFITQSSVEKLVESIVDSVETVSISKLELSEFEKKVKKNEYVENCNAYINNSGELEFEIEQKQPVFRVIHENGVSYYVDKSGIKFSVSPTFTANVPIATGKIVYDVDSLSVQQGLAINDLLEFFDFLNHHEFAQSLVTYVNVEPNGDYVFIPRIGDHEVNLGSMDNLDEKFERLQIFYEEGLNKIGWDKYSQINLKFKNQIIAKKKE